MKDKFLLNIHNSGGILVHRLRPHIKRRNSIQCKMGSMEEGNTSSRSPESFSQEKLVFSQENCRIFQVG